MAATPLLGHAIILDTLTGMGKAALAAAVPCTGKETQISHEEQGSTKQFV